MAEIERISEATVSLIAARAAELQGDKETLLIRIEETEAQYRTSLRAAVRGLWKGALDINQAFEAYNSAVRRGLTRAFHDGLAQVGIMPAEMTPEERTELDVAIATEEQFIFPFLSDVEANDEASGAKLGPHLRRVDRWVPRWRQLKNKALQMAGQDQKYKWIINPAKENCRSCQKLANKVKRLSYWRRAGVVPQSMVLQ